MPAEREEDCPKRMVFDPEDKMCYDISARKNNKKVAEVAKANIGRQDAKLKAAKLDKSVRTVEARFARITAASKLYPKTWTLEPGDKGFNAEALRAMQKAGVDKSPFEVSCPPHGQLLDKAKVTDQPYQKTAAFLFHPNSPAQRLLVAVRTGGGKTLIMIRALSNFFDDRRPKLVVFPNDLIAKQFYGELMAYDNPYRSYVLEELGNKASADYVARARKNALNGDEIQTVEDILGLKGHPGQAGKPGYLAAPLRVVTYRALGGATVNSMAWIRPKHGNIMLPAAGGGKARVNILEDKIVIMDEAQNLIKPNPEVLKLESTRENLERAREMLRLATKSAVALFTATPVIDDPADGEKLMRIVRGVANEHKPTNEGFITSFVSNPSSAYPTVEPLAEEMPKLVSVPLSGEPDDKGSSLGNYLDHLLKGGQGKKVIDPAFLKSKTRGIYEYTAAYTTSQTNPAFLKKLRDTPDTAAPKLLAAARLAAAHEGKVILLTNTQNGFYSLHYMFQNCAEFAGMKDKVMPLLGSRKTTRADFKASCNGTSFTNWKQYTTCVREKFDAGNNIHGEHLKILILNAEEYSEGIDFKDVRAVIMVDVPESWAKLKQRVGRAVRQCSHIRLNKDQWSVHTYILCATLPPKVHFKSGQELDLSGVPTVDEQMLVRVMAQRAVIESKTCDLVNAAMDRKILGKAAGTDACNNPNRRKSSSNAKEEEQEQEPPGPTKKQREDMAVAIKQVAEAHKAYKQCLSLAQKVSDVAKQTEALSKCSAKYQEVVEAIVENLVPWYSAANEQGAINCPMSLDAAGCAAFCDEELPITTDKDTGVQYNAKENALCRERHNTAPRRGSLSSDSNSSGDIAALAFGDALQNAMQPFSSSVAATGAKCENCPDGKTEAQCFEF
ncbi:DEAD/DEAH box helicase, partial [Asticcacaulis sp.]|uniref:DEAD/DEAH box helicase n=1 Tax=Asticcacaulis sp. TaxID=1872648 RepID=UPI0026219C01